MRSATTSLEPRRLPVVGLAVAGGVDAGGHVIGVDAHHIAQGAVALEGEVFLVVVHIEHRLGGVLDLPDHRDTDLHRIAQAIVDLLAGVVQGHPLEGDLFAAVGGCRGLVGRPPCPAPQPARPVASPFWTSPLWLRRVPAAGLTAVQKGLTQLKALPFQGADVVAEQGQHQSLLGLEDLQPAQ